MDMEVTNKQLDFINDIDLRQVLEDRLNELDRLFKVNANVGTVFLSMSTIEGVFKHIAAIYRTEIKRSGTYPTNPRTGKKKDFYKLTLDELYVQLVELGILPDIPEYAHLYKLFKNYRNFIHPQAQAAKGWVIGLGQAQMALGLLNSTIHDLDRNVFIEKDRFEKVAGRPHYDSKKVLNLTYTSSSHNSFLVLANPVSRTLRLTFDLDLPSDSLLNFVFNYVNEGDFKMVRLDNRPVENYVNGVLRSTQKYLWKQVLFADHQKLP